MVAANTSLASQSFARRKRGPPLVNGSLEVHTHIWSSRCFWWLSVSYHQTEKKLVVRSLLRNEHHEPSKMCVGRVEENVEHLAVFRWIGTLYWDARLGYVHENHKLFMMFSAKSYGKLRI